MRSLEERSRIIRMTAEEKRKAEMATVKKMLEIYCRAHHGNNLSLCEECEALLDYARARVERCPHMETKTFCSACQTHCYAPKMREKIRELQQSLGITSLYVTHDQSEAFAVSDQVIVMDKGRIMQKASARELYQRPNSLFLANFMGESSIFAAELAGSRLSVNGYSFDLPDAAAFLKTVPASPASAPKPSP